MNRLADRLHYLNSSGDKAQDSTRFWFDVRANLRREMEDRKGRFDDKNEVIGKIASLLKKTTAGVLGFDGTHIFTPHGDVPDDGSLRLVLLPPESAYSKEDPSIAFDAVNEFVKNNGTKPRYRGNRLIFVAPGLPSMSRLKDTVRTVLAWSSIVEDVKDGRLNIDRLQENQAKKELETAEAVAVRVVRECFRWVLCPYMANPTDQSPTVEAFQLNTSGSGFGPEVDRVCEENELVIGTWSPIHLRSKLQELYWKDEKQTIPAMTFWEDSLRYLYLPRLKTKGVLEQAIVKGAGSNDFFGTAYGQSDDKYDGFKFGDSNVQLDDTLILIEPSAATEYKASIAKSKVTSDPQTGDGGDLPTDAGPSPDQDDKATDSGNGGGGSQAILFDKSKVFYGSIEISPSTAKMGMVQVADEIINLLASDPNASLRITVEINAEFPDGASDQIKRAVSENANSLGFSTKTWE